MSNRYKFPTIKHLPWSQSYTSDDSWLSSASAFEGEEVVVTCKMDGECLHEGTLISTPGGDVPIEEIVKNDSPPLIYSLSHETGQIEAVPIKNSFARQKEKIWFEIELEDGKILILTGDHLIFLPELNCYRQVEYLTGNETVLVK